MKENEKKLDLGEFFYVFKKHIIIEAVILLVCIIAGFVAAYLTPRYYVASVDVFVDADGGGSVTTDASLAKYYVPSICDSIKGDYIVSTASRESGKKCSASAITVNNEENSLIINIKYKDNSEENAKVKLMAVVSALKSFYETGEGNSSNPLLNKKLKISPQYAAYESDGITQVPVVTAGSKKRTVVVLAAVIGVAAMFVYTLCVYFIADKVASVDRLESVSGIKNLATVEKKKTDKKEQKSPDALVELKLTKVADALIYDNICTGNKIYQVQSCLSGEGKTTVVANLAIALGKAQRKTLIVDCDFSHPTVHRKFLLHRHLGITEYFKGEKTFDEIVKTTAYTNVDVITCGERIENHTIFFTSDKFKSLLAEAKGKYDFILFDCAPVKVVSDYINISQLADAALLVVANEKVSAKDVAYAVEELDSSKANLIGTVFNFTDAVKNRSYYNYYYNKTAEEAKETTEE